MGPSYVSVCGLERAVRGTAAAAAIRVGQSVVRARRSPPRPPPMTSTGEFGTISYAGACIVQAVSERTWPKKCICH